MAILYFASLAPFSGSMAFISILTCKFQGKNQSSVHSVQWTYCVQRERERKGPEMIQKTVLFPVSSSRLVTMTVSLPDASEKSAIVAACSISLSRIDDVSDVTAATFTCIEVGDKRSIPQVNHRNVHLNKYVFGWQTEKYIVKELGCCLLFYQNSNDDW